MDSSLTVNDLVAAFARFTLYTQAEIIRRANATNDHMLNDPSWEGIFTTVETVPVNGYITVPRQWGKAFGAEFCGTGRPIRQGFAEFIEYGMGRQDPSKMCIDGLIHEGFNACTQTEIWSAGEETPGTLRLVIDNPADANKAWYFHGSFTDTDGIDRDIYTGAVRGFPLTSMTPSVDYPTNLVKHLEGIQAPTGLIGRWHLFKVINGTPNWIGTYDPDEVRPRYHRYKMCALTGPAPKVHLYCQRQYVPLVNLTDWLPLPMVEIYEHGFNALTARDKPDIKTEEQAWKQASNTLVRYIEKTCPRPRISFSSDLPGSRNGRFGLGSRPWR